MRTLWRILLDTLFPPTDHERYLRNVTPTVFLIHYCPTNISDTIALAPYSSRVVQAAVGACKFEKNQWAAKLLSQLLPRWLEEHPTSGNTILIPIPLSRSREKERGFNQVTRVLEYMPRTAEIKIEKQWLVRPADTVRQTSLGRQARLTNMKKAFVVSDKVRTLDWSKIARVIICDDVLTTGATLESARAVLAEHVPKHVQLLCLAWAH